MLNHPILDQLLSLKLIGMHRALTGFVWIR